FWCANMPEQPQYYLVRNAASWWPLSMLLMIGRFFCPFSILLLQGIKKRPHQLCIVAGWIMLMQALDMYLIVLPSLHGTGVHLSIWDFLCPIAIGCSLAFLYLRLVGKTSTFPVRDPRLIESLRVRNWHGRSRSNADTRTRADFFWGVARDRFAISVLLNFRLGADRIH